MTATDTAAEITRDVCIVGGPLCGKTTRLAEHARDLVYAGDDVLVLVAAPTAAEPMRTLLAGLLGGRADRARVALPRDIALEVLADAPSSTRGGRDARLIEPFEARFVMEDLRATRLKGRRLRDVLGFLEGGLANLADDDPAWIQTSEERLILGHLRATLAFTGGILPCELANLAVRALRADEGLLARHARAHVLVDDFNLLEGASQQLACMLARRSVAIAADDAHALPVYEQYPNPDGMRALIQERPVAQKIVLAGDHRPRSIAQVVANLRTDDALAPACPVLGAAAPTAGDGPLDPANRPEPAPANAPGETAVPEPTQIHAVPEQADCVEVRMCATMGEELRTIFSAVAQTLETGGTALVVGTNGVWRANVARALESAGIAVERPARSVDVRDFRDERANRPALDATLDRLVADAHDGVAWRTLVGLGDHMARSAALDQLRTTALPQSMSIDQALAALAAGELPGADPCDPIYAGLVEAYHAGLELIERRRAEQGVLAGGGEPSPAPTIPSDGAAQSVSPADEAAPGAGASQATGVAAPASIATRQADLLGNEQDRPSILPSAPHVAVVAPHETFGRQADLVVLGGFVNGFIPSRDYLDPGALVGSARRREHERDVRRVYLAAGRARERLLVTGFTSATLETAERLGLHIARIRLKRGVRECQIEPSELLGLMMPRPSP